MDWLLYDWGLNHERVSRQSLHLFPNALFSLTVHTLNSVIHRADVRSCNAPTVHLK